MIVWRNVRERFRFIIIVYDVFLNNNNNKYVLSFQKDLLNITDRAWSTETYYNTHIIIIYYNRYIIIFITFVYFNIMKLSIYYNIYILLFKHARPLLILK